MRARGIFIALAIGCSAPVAPPRPPPSPPTPDAIAVTPDAPPDAAPAALGAACGPEQPCEEGARCLAWPGGSCARACDASCGPAGRCVELVLADGPAERCLPACTTDADCRADEGYACDPTWHACTLPNAPAIVPRTCPPPAGIARDPAFLPATPLGAGRAPSAVVLPDGAVAVLYAGATGALQLARIDAANRVTTTALPVEGAVDQARLARGPGGALFAIWRITRDGGHAIELAASRDHGATWSPAIRIDDPADCAGVRDARACPADPRVIARGGELVVAYAARGLRVRTSRDGLRFGPPVTATAGTRGALAVARDGTLYAAALAGSAFAAYGSGAHRVELAVAPPGGLELGPPQPISRDGEQLPWWFAIPAIARDDRRDRLYLGYVRGGRAATWDLVIALTRDRGKTWIRRRLGDAPACALEAAPALALDPTTGTLHVAWFDSRGPRFAHATCTLAGCRARGRIDSVPFAAMSLLPGSPRAIDDHAVLVIDDRRRTLHAVWAQPVDQGGGVVAPQVFHARARLGPR